MNFHWVDQLRPFLWLAPHFVDQYFIVFKEQIFKKLRFEYSTQDYVNTWPQFVFKAGTIHGLLLKKNFFLHLVAKYSW